MKKYLQFLNESQDGSDIILYHGTNSDFNKFDINKSGDVHYSDWGKGIYFTSSKSQANGYRVDAVKKTNKGYNDSYEEYEQSERDLKNVKHGTEEYNELRKLVSIKLKEFQKVGQELNSTKEGKLIIAKIKPGAKIYRYNTSSGMTDPSLSNYASSRGYDIILVDEDRWTEEYVVLNPDSIEITGEIKQ
jgi:hypothetical protein